jgi:putative ABC transport system substrate-binding protein
MVPFRMGSRMRRREFIVALTSAVTLPPAAYAQSSQLPVIGFLGTTTPSTQKQWNDAFVHRLRELGWIDGRTVTIEYRWAEGRTNRFAEIAAEFVRLQVDVIVTGGGAVLPAKQATAVIPIVFALAGDPLGSGMVASLSRPGGNVTGLSLQNPDVVGKRIELLREVIPNLHKLSILANVGYAAAVVEMNEVQALAKTLGLEVVTLEIRRAEEIVPAFEGLVGGPQALYVCSDPLINTNRARINELSLKAGLPTSHVLREYVEADGLMSYGPNIPDLFRRSAEYVDKILRGAKPGDLPVEQPTRFDLVINLKTAKALGITIPPSLLARADEVIE